MEHSENKPFFRLGSYWYTPQHPFFLPVVSGGDGEIEETDEEREAREAEEAESGGDKGTKKLDLTQTDLSRITTREKKEGIAKGRKDLMKKLGVDTEEELESLVSSHREATEREKSDTQKAREAADKERAEAEAEKKAAKQDRFEAKCERELLVSGCPVKSIVRVAKLLEISSEDDPDQDDIKEAVEALKKEMPQLFAVKDNEEEENGGNKHSDTGTGTRQSKGKKTSAEQAQDELARRHPELAKKT